MSAPTLTAANQARLEKALDRLYRFPDLGVTTFRAVIESGNVAYTVQHHGTDRRATYGLILTADAAEALTREPSSYYPGANNPLQGLTWAPFLECPKIVADSVSVPRVITANDRFEVSE